VTSSNPITSINIRPGVNLLGALKHIQYEPWFALAEFIDNSIASYQKYETELQSIHLNKFKLVIKITRDSDHNTITILDNAAGIHSEDFQRAFTTAEIPPDRSGLSEFGMGMKAAAFWFGDAWKVTTKALGENVERQVNFDIQQIEKHQSEELKVDETSALPKHHFTRIELKKLTKFPQRRTLGTIKEHLSSIYRDFFRKGILEIYLDNELLVFSEPKILVAPPYDDQNSEPIEWKVPVDFSVGIGRRVNGFAAIREQGSLKLAGFSLLRRGRVIEGVYDKTYRPEEIFGQSNSFRYQRIFGELHFEGFDVSFTKNGIQWDNYYEDFIEQIKKPLKRLLSQADNFRAQTSQKEIKRVVEKVVVNTGKELETELPVAVENTIEKAAERAKDPIVTESFPETKESSYYEFSMPVKGIDYLLKIEISYDKKILDLYTLKEEKINNTQRKLEIRLSLVHNWMTKFVDSDPDKMELILRFISMLGISESLARMADDGNGLGDIRINFNELANHSHNTKPIIK